MPDGTPRFVEVALPGEADYTRRQLTPELLVPDALFRVTTSLDDLVSGLAVTMPLPGLEVNGAKPLPIFFPECEAKIKNNFQQRGRRRTSFYGTIDHDGLVLLPTELNIIPHYAKAKNEQSLSFHVHSSLRSTDTKWIGAALVRCTLYPGKVTIGPSDTTVDIKLATRIAASDRDMGLVELRTASHLRAFFAPIVNEILARSTPTEGRIRRKASETWR